MTLVAVATPRIVATAILFCISVCFLPSIICSAAFLHKACVTRYARCFLCTTKRPFCARALDIHQQQREYLCSKKCVARARRLSTRFFSVRTQREDFSSLWCWARALAAAGSSISITPPFLRVWHFAVVRAPWRKFFYNCAKFTGRARDKP